MATTNQVVRVARPAAPQAQPVNANALAMFDPQNVPKHIVEFNETHSNIADKLSVDSLTFKGKVWTLNINGNKQPLMVKDQDGDLQPRQTLSLVILGYNPRRGRSYYDTGFEDDRPKQPTCWSPDGITPNKSSLELQADKCANCPKAVKGSKVDEAGNESVACGGYRMAAVQLYRAWPDIPPVRLRLAVTSDYDGQNKENEAQGWYAFSNLMDLLRARGVKHTASVVVKAKFDSAKAYPKLLFSPVGWVTEDEKDIIAPLADPDNAEVAALLSQNYTPAGGDNIATDVVATDDGEPVAGPTAPAPKSGKAGKATTAKAKQPEPEPEPEAEEATNYVDENGNPCDEHGNPLPDDSQDVAEEVNYVDENGNPCDENGNPLTDAVGDIVEAAEAEVDDAETIAAAKAAEAREAALKKQQAKAATAAATRKAQPADDEGAIVLGKPQQPKPAVVTRQATPAKAPVATAKPAVNGAAKVTVAAKAPAVVTRAATPAKVTVATKAPATGAAAAGKAGKPAPAAVSGKVGAMLQDWQDD